MGFILSESLFRNYNPRSSMNNFPYTCIVIIGTTGSGKSTLARQLAVKTAVTFVELDALYWEPNWVEAPDAVFRERVKVATNSTAWVVAGNYHMVRDLIWPKAQAIIWLDYPFHIVFWRLLRRTMRRAVTKERLFSGNVENFWTHMKLWSDDSLFHWLFKTYWRRKKEYPELFKASENAHLKILHFQHPREAEDWLDSILIP